MKAGRRTRLPNLLLALIFILTLLTGCWDRQEIEERALVLGIGIDTVEKSSEQKESDVTHTNDMVPAPASDMLRLTVQIAVPGRIPLGPGQGGGAAAGGGSKSVWVVDVVGHTIDDAIENLQQRIASPLFFGHLRIIAISEEFAKRGIDNLNEYFRRNPEVRRMNWAFVCKGKAEKFMRAAPELERVPTIYFLTTMDQSVKMGHFPNDFLGIFWSATSAKGREGYLPYMEIKEKDSILISGLAFFRSDKMVGVTTPIEVNTLMAIKGMNPADGQMAAQIPGTSTDVIFGARTRKSRTRVKMVGGEPQIDVKIYIEGNLIEKNNDLTDLNPNVIKQIQGQLEAEQKKLCEELIAKTQAKKSDIFGFGEYVRAKKPFYWNRHIGSEEKWQEAYKDLKVNVEVKMNIRRVGMKAK